MVSFTIKMQIYYKLNDEYIRNNVLILYYIDPYGRSG